MEDGTSRSPRHCANTDDPYDPRQWDTREDCEVRQILDRIADKWSLLVIALLDRRVLRFTQLRQEVDGISQRMLTVTLRQLERDGLVRRTVHAVVPPRVDYELTPLGATLHQTIQPLVEWTERHQNEIAAARAGYDATKLDLDPPERDETQGRARNETRGEPLPGCELCGAPIRPAGTGRPAKFCGTACRQRAHRQRAPIA
jgi:DNA-binding HxlR family transcriptional regulator